MSETQRDSVSEWIGGVISLPVYVTGEGEPYRPEVLYWAAPNGTLVGHSTGRPGSWFRQACNALRSAMERPLSGPPQRPHRVRVASPDLARVLREGHKGIQVVCAPTPESDGVARSVVEMMVSALREEKSYLRTDADPEAIGAFFRATAALGRANPWRGLAAGPFLIAVSSEELLLDDLPVSISGRPGERQRLDLFYGIFDYDDYIGADDATPPEEDAELPPFLSLSFEPGAELGEAVRKEVAEREWEVAIPDVLPWLAAADEEHIQRPAQASEFEVFEAISLALTKVLEEQPALLSAYTGGTPIVRTLRVATHAREVELSLRFPYRLEPREGESSSDMLARLTDLGEGEEFFDYWVGRKLEMALMRRFEASPEGQAISNIEHCHLLMGFGARQFCANMATLQPDDLRRLLFEVIPPAVCIDPSDAGAMISDLRALYSFLDRECGHKHARACMSVVAGDATKRLEAALKAAAKPGAPEKFSLVPRGEGSRTGSARGNAVRSGRYGEPPLSSPPQRAAHPGARQAAAVADRAKKAARKAARKARKKNR